ncbi:unnamed protein product [Paramecium pentaurelia]|uniref:Transmembrane protein n=1 Tax=Paramecium pentaurelia TaxID=43138 RepID=A0A8S1XQT5_9CILI|nr:unnamed protein product [Paramecium pentaurelia]
MIGHTIFLHNYRFIDSILVFSIEYRIKLINVVVLVHTMILHNIMNLLYIHQIQKLLNYTQILITIYFIYFQQLKNFWSLHLLMISVILRDQESKRIIKYLNLNITYLAKYMNKENEINVLLKNFLFQATNASLKLRNVTFF